MANIIQLRTDNEAQWTLYNPILARGELAMSSDTVPQKFKVGDGVSAWSALVYFAGLTGSTGLQGIQGETGLQGIQGAPGDAGIQGIAGDPATLIDDDGTSVSGLWSSQKTSDQFAAILALKWTEKFILCNAADAFISPSLPLSRDGTMAIVDFYAQSIPSVATTITVKQNGTTLSPAISLSVEGKATLTFDIAVTGSADDIFTYVVGGAGLVDCIVTCNQKWGNR